MALGMNQRIPACYKLGTSLSVCGQAMLVHVCMYVSLTITHHTGCQASVLTRFVYDITINSSVHSSLRQYAMVLSN